MISLIAQDAPAATLAPENTLTFSEVIAPYMPVFFVAFIVALILTPIMRSLATHNNVVDKPDLVRKNHIQAVAYLGGVAIFFGWLAGVFMGYFTEPHESMTLVSLSYVNFPGWVIFGAGIICLTGLIDDVYSLSPRIKVAGQLFGAAMLAHENVGTQIVHELTVATEQTTGFAFPIPDAIMTAPYGLEYWLGAALIAFLVLGACNALNLIDGLDGLAGGVTVISATGFLIIAALVALQTQDAQIVAEGVLSHPIRIVMCLAIIGAVLGFLPYNFNPATIFMGDAGSLLLGYLCIATILMFATVPGKALLLVTASLITFAVPITDTSLAIFRRKMRGQPLFSPDSQHIHHLLRRAGLSVKQAVLVMYLAAASFAAIGCAMVAYEIRWRYALAAFIVLYAFIMVTAYKYGEHQWLLEKMKDQDTDSEPDADPDAPPAA
ncbi:glycosyltransferase family 4 protein [Mucisphaera calidilacus]|uniref:WecA-like glycosyltransferase n=1 Tax=Mucisphaera calidilacus TaxID=2527982 RepID=A0A518BTE8_9BACT|nr:MraY family glycosyltransferase [Mucisphaera calidilacus]QDU70252.1 WecA-like glycosyltransferase [Mucisphaera calidilacus]